MGRIRAKEKSQRGQSERGRKHSHCVILPATLDTNADDLQKVEKCWFVQTSAVSDLTVTVEEYTFHLHKLEMVSRSRYLNRLVFQRRSTAEANSSVLINIENLPGGYKIFQLIVRFCYGLPVDLTAENTAPLYCAAHFLEMTEDLQPENLICKAKAFLSFIIFSSWKDSIQILKSCEDISLWAEELGILKQCSDSLAWKACIDPELIARNGGEESTEKSKNKEGGNGQVIEDSWWFEDVSSLRIDHFVQVMNTAKARGMKPRLVGSCIAYWTSKWLQKTKLKTNCEFTVQRDTFISLIKVLPDGKNSICCNYLLHLLKVGLVLKIDSDLTRHLERRVAKMLERISARDLIIDNYKQNGANYDVGLVIRVVEAYLTYISRNPTSRIDLVGKLLDDYLALVARDDYLSVESFQFLAEALPENARICNDKLYRAVDMYLKAHPTLTEEERGTVCRAMEFHKLSQEARNHAIKNDRLPLNITTRLILWEQVNISKSMLSNNLNYRRSRDFDSVRKVSDKRWFEAHQELQTMKTKVEKLKLQVSNLQVCSLKLQNQLKVGLR